MSNTYHLPLSVDDLANYEKALIEAELQIQKARLHVVNLREDSGNAALAVTALAAAATQLTAATDLVVTVS